jgi:hypothetical protein
MLYFQLQAQPNPEIPICSKYILYSVCYALAAGFEGLLRHEMPIKNVLRAFFPGITSGMATGVHKLIFEQRIHRRL